MKNSPITHVTIAAFAACTLTSSVYAQDTVAGSWGGKIRSGPGTQYRQIGSLRNGDPVGLIEDTGVMMNGYPWFRIRLKNGRRGFQWGGILCGYNSPVNGTHGVCERDNRRKVSNGSQRTKYACSHEGRLRSTKGDIKTNLNFRVVGENDETQFKIYWLDYQGRRQFYKHVFAGDSYNQGTFMTHPWLVTSPIPGGGEDCIAIYMPNQGGRTITLR